MQSLPNLGDRLLLIGRVLPRIHSSLAQPSSPISALQRVTPEMSVVVRVPLLQFNDFLKRFFKKEHDILAHDPSSLAQEGDTVLLQRLTSQQRSQKEIHFEVKELVHRLGDVRFSDGQPVVGQHFRHQQDQVAEMYGRGESAFRYEKAPPRGWQRGKRDFADRVTYYKWHVFADDPKDGYGIVG